MEAENLMNGHKEHYLTQFYTIEQIFQYTQGRQELLDELYNRLQPKRVPIESLRGVDTKQARVYVSSPDGYVPVLDCIKKIKNELFSFTFDSGQIITASHDHMYQKPDMSWHYARNLCVGDALLSDSGESVITAITPLSGDTEVYDLSVGHENHRYYTDKICSHNSGKSLIKQNIAVNWITAGLSGVYITLELSEDLCAMRIDSMLSNIASRDIFKNIDDVELKIKMAAKKCGNFQIKYLPAQSTANDIKVYLKEFQIQTGKKVDFLIVDYLDLLMPARAKVSASDLFAKDKYVAEEMRNLAIELDILLVTSSQLNRGATDEVEFDHSHISGGITKIFTADNVIGIFTSRGLREQGKYQLQMMKTRNSGGLYGKIDLGFDQDTLRITDLGENAQSTVSSSMSANNVLNTIKNKPKTGPDSNAAKPVKAEVQSTQLKNLLATLKQKTTDM